MVLATSTSDLRSGSIKSDLGDQISRLLSESPNFISLFPIRGTVDNPKHEWLQDTVKPFDVAYASSTNAGVFTFDSASKAASFNVGELVTLKGSSVLLRVTAVSATDMTVTTSFVDANGSGLTASTIPVTAGTLRFVTRPFPEGTTEGRVTFRQSTPEYNYTQIIRGEINLTDTALKSAVYGNEASIIEQSAGALDIHTREINYTAIMGRRQIRNKDLSQEGRVGGLYEFGLTACGGGVNAKPAGTAHGLGITDINDAAQKILDLGGTPTTILCHPSQRRVIGKALQSYIRYSPTDATRGTYVDTVVCDTNGSALRVFSDAAFPETDVWVVDASGFGLVPYNGRWGMTKDAGDNGYDGRQISFLSEYTFEFKNANARLCRIYNLLKAPEALAAM